MQTILLLIGLILIYTVTRLIMAEFKEDLDKIKQYKPVSTLLLVMVVLLSFMVSGHRLQYSFLILLGLAFSFGGDMALMYRQQIKMFRLGLASFLIAHIVYIIAFIAYAGFSTRDIFSGVILGIAAVVIYWFLRPGLEGMTIPVVFYIVIISLMVNRAFAAFFTDVFTLEQGILISTGAVLFYISDVILAVARFRFPFRYNRISLAFYYSGQLLIALSTHLFI